MDWEGRSLRFGAGIVACAVVLRLGLGGALAPVEHFLKSSTFASFLIYLQTGRVVRPTSSHTIVLTSPESDPTEPPADKPVFTASDLELVTVDYACSYAPDLAELLTQPLDWDLTGDEPTVLILHTHTTESYTMTDADRYTETSTYRTLDPEHNLLCLGELVAGILEKVGIRVIHDTTLHDYPNYTGAYNRSAVTVQSWLEQYPSIRLVLDLHRDAADTAAGQMATSCTVDGVESAQLMMVVGTDEGGLTHDDWPANLALALKLQVLLEQENRGICRDLKLTRQRYNQHLGDRALLIEIGAAGDTLPEAKNAATALAEAIVKLAGGTA